jgi:tight adherence protein C
MNSMGLLVVGVAAILAGLGSVVMIVGTGRSQRQAVGRQLAGIGGISLNRTTAGSEPVSFQGRVLVPALHRLSLLGRRLTPTGAAEKLQHRLDLAGNPRGYDVQQILGSKVVGLMASALLGLWFGSSGGLLRALLLGVVLGAVGFFLPDVLLYNSGTKRQLKMQDTLPDALDLLSISVEAGLGFDGALAQVARNTDGPLAGEFFRLLQEMQIGKTRADAFRGMSARTSVAALKGFTSSIVQADTLGIPIVNVLRQQAAEMRLKRMQRAEEKAMKVPVKILIPTVVFILPAMFVVLLGPAGISIARVFNG